MTFAEWCNRAKLWVDSKFIELFNQYQKSATIRSTTSCQMRLREGREAACFFDARELSSLQVAFRSISSVSAASSTGGSVFVHHSSLSTLDRRTLAGRERIAGSWGVQSAQNRASYSFSPPTRHGGQIFHWAACANVTYPDIPKYLLQRTKWDWSAW